MRVIVAFFICALAGLPGFAQPASGVGYATVQQAFEALRSDPGAKGGFRDGWLIASVADGENQGVWSFTPKEHPAHPAVVRRIPKEKDGQIYIDMRVLCGADKTAYDQLVEEFKTLNEKMAEDIKKR
jgi:hypothetical protein